MAFKPLLCLFPGVVCMVWFCVQLQMSVEMTNDSSCKKKPNIESFEMVEQHTFFSSAH